jgi:hypothetical protein
MLYYLYKALAYYSSLSHLVSIYIGLLSLPKRRLIESYINR